MASQLREVLNRFSDQSAPISIQKMAREMKLEVGVLQGMIEYWIRKGKLREVVGNHTGCTTCGIKGECPFIMTLPRYYELADENDPPVCASDTPCNNGGTCNC